MPRPAQHGEPGPTLLVHESSSNISWKMESEVCFGSEIFKIHAVCVYNRHALELFVDPLIDLDFKVFYTQTSYVLIPSPTDFLKFPYSFCTDVQATCLLS